MGKKAEPTETPAEKGEEETTDASAEKEEEAGAEQVYSDKREDIEAQYEKQQEQEQESPLQSDNEKEETGEPAEKAGEEEPTETPAEPGETEPSAELEDIQKNKPEEDRTVPHGAFHEEREKRKEAERKLKELQSQREREETEEETPIEDYDLEINMLKKKIGVMEAKDSQREQERAEGRQKKQKIEVDKLISNTAESLDAEGCPGFKEYRKIILGEIFEKAQNEPDLDLRHKYMSGELAYPDDNPEGWKKIYKEIVYPRYKRLHSAQDKKDLMEKKRLRKEGASLVNTPGAGTVEHSKTEKSEFDEYMETHPSRKTG